MNVALQCMLDRCGTEFFAQVDEDILLFPHAIRTLYEHIRQADAKVAMYVANLYDEHLDRCIRGVKIYRHAIVCRYPYRDLESCEKDQVKRFEADGYRVVAEPHEGTVRTSPETLGLHGGHWTPQSIYERYLTLAQKLRRHPYPMRWFRGYPRRFLDDFLNDPSELNFFALMGPVVGSVIALDGSGTEKDHTQYDELPGWKELQALWRDHMNSREPA